MKTVSKPWGKEEWLELNDRYCYKRIYINKDYKTSYQYHKKKIETNYIISGIAEVWLENENGIVEKTIKKDGDFFNVAPPRKHRIIAITDLILQEVSTPEVDDVIRIDDDTNRKNGRIEEEHKKIFPSVLILSAGIGHRLKEETKCKNKALVSINSQATISHIINYIPRKSEIVIAVGYEKNSLIEYCNLAHPDRSFKFVEVEKWENPETDPGYSAWQCREYLQNPFYLISVDTIIDSELPDLDSDWIGVCHSNEAYQYATVSSIYEKYVLSVNQKDKEIKSADAFIGLAGIFNHKIFWDELEKNSLNFELLKAWSNPSAYQSIKIKRLRWFDTGNLESLSITKKHFDKNPIASEKDIHDTTYFVNKSILKFTANQEENYKKIERAEILSKQIPFITDKGNYFIKYDWIDGLNLYQKDSFEIYKKFLFFLENIISKSNFYDINQNLIESFYINKTQDRIKKFKEKYGNKYFLNSLTINNVNYPPLNSLLEKIDYSNLLIRNKIKKPLYDHFHGDLHFDNVIIDNEDQYHYIDWRSSFAGETKFGDLYYDLSKLYCGCIFPFDLFDKEDDVKFVETDSIEYEYEIPKSLNNFKIYYEDWISKYDVSTIKLITALSFLNIAPLHKEKYGKIFLSKAIEILYELQRK